MRKTKEVKTMLQQNNSSEMIDATPTKTLFVDILTRDISVKSCILDLIDNAVDSYIRKDINDRRKIKITITKEKFEIVDYCGGIGKKMLINEVFRFGAEDLEKDKYTLGVYGIGLKRAILKLGKDISLKTDDGKEFSLVELNIPKWMKIKGKDYWKIPFKETSTSKLKEDEKPYTKIIIKDLYPSIKEKLDLASFLNELRDTIHITYTIFITKHIDFFLNKEIIPPYDILVRDDERYKPAKIVDTFEEIEIQIICFIDIGGGKRTTKELGKRGWNIFCNDRLILHEDTSPITGWTGEKSDLPKYHPIYNEFRGLVFLSSNNPSKLPLNTTKDGLDDDTRIYQYVLSKMIKTARPIIDYLSKKYDEEKSTMEQIDEKMKSEEKEDEQSDKESEKDAKYVKISELKGPSEFKAPERKKLKTKFVNIIYKKPKQIVEKVKKSLKVTSNKDVGKRTFEYYVDLEDLKDE